LFLEVIEPLLFPRTESDGQATITVSKISGKKIVGYSFHRLWRRENRRKKRQRTVKL